MPTSFTYVKKGYNPIEVDNYIETLENVVKSYKEKDAAIKNAIINAQIAADNIIKDAEKKSDMIFDQVAQKIELIKTSLDKQRRIAMQFQNDYNTLIQKYVHNFNESDMQEVFGSISELEAFLTNIVGESPKDQVETQAQATPETKKTDYSTREDNADIAELLNLK